MSSVISLFGGLLLPAVSVHHAANRMHADGTQHFGGSKHVSHDQLTADGMQYFGGPKHISHDQLAVESAERGSGSGRLPCSCLFH